MTISYATSSDLASWLGTAAPTGATALLRSASLLVRDATMAALYDADATTGLPTDAVLATAVKEAACAHAAALSAAGVNPLAAGTDAGIGATSIGSASVTYAGADRAAALRAQLTTNLCQESLRILRAAGLLAMPPLAFRG